MICYELYFSAHFLIIFTRAEGSTRAVICRFYFAKLWYHSFSLGQSERNWEASEGPEESSVAGNIHSAGQFWHNKLQASKFVLDIIDNGYRLPFERPCPPFYAKNNASSLSHADFVAEAIQKLVKHKCVKEVGEMPYCCNPLTVASKGKKLRLVLDLRHFNQFMRKYKFR